MTTEDTEHTELSAEVRYPGGLQGTVYYQPESPEIAVLEPGAGLLACIMPVACLLVSPGAPPIALASSFCRKRSRPERDRRTDESENFASGVNGLGKPF